MILLEQLEMSRTAIMEKAFKMVLDLKVSMDFMASILSLVAQEAKIFRFLQITCLETMFSK